MTEPIDVVYLWVDGDWPGFREERDRLAQTAHDSDPARYRDNLDLLKYSLRGLAPNLPWIRNVYLVTARPQRPSWLKDHPRLRLVHHDAFIPADVLPLYNSNALIAHLERLPGLSRRFIYAEDDFLWTAPTTLSFFTDAQNRLRVHQRLGHTPDASQRNGAHTLLVNAAWAHNNHLLDTAFGQRRRTTYTHAPLLFDRDLWREMAAKWPHEIAATMTHRFRRPDDAIPVYIYRHFLLNTGRAVTVPRLRTYLEAHYHGLESFAPWVWIGLNFIRAVQPNTTCLGDNWGPQPPPRIVAMVRRFLDRLYPDKSPFEA